MFDSYSARFVVRAFSAFRLGRAMRWFPGLRREFTRAPCSLTRRTPARRLRDVNFLFLVDVPHEVEERADAGHDG